MSQKIGVKVSKLGQKLGFKADSKTPQRLDLTSLLGQVSVYQPNETASTLTDILNDALLKLDGKGDSKTLIDQANKTANGIRLSLEKLKKEKEEAEKLEKSKRPSKKEVKTMKKLQEELEKELDKVLEKLDPTLGTIRLVGDLGKTALVSSGETIRREIHAGDPNEGDRDGDIRSDIEALELRISKTNLAHSKEGAFMTGLAPSRVKGAEALLKKFNEQVGGNYQGPLLQTVEKLRMAMTAKPADPAVIRSLLSQTEEIDKAATKQVGFVKDSHNDATAQKNGEALGRKLEDMLKPVNESLDFLGDAEAPDYDKLETELQGLRNKAGKPIADSAVKQATQDVINEVAELAKKITKQRQDLETTITQAGLATQKALAEAKQLFQTQQNLHKDAKPLESDFKAIEALIGSAEDRVPATGALPKGLTVKDVQLAQRLAEQAASRLNDIKKNTASLLDFDKETKGLAKELESRSFFQKIKGNDKGTLEKYDPTTRELFETKLQALLKELPTTAAKKSIEDLQKLKDEAQKAMDDLAKPVDLLEKKAQPLYSQMNGLRIGWILGTDGGSLTKGPKTFDEALDALEAQIKLQPPVEISLQAAYDTALIEFNKAKSMSMDDLMKQVGQDTKDEKKADKANEKRRSEEDKLLERLQIKYNAAKEAVDKVDGDKNSLATANRLIEQIKADIKGNRFDKLESKRNDLDARLKLLLSNPRGEVNRHRSELPGVISELRGAIGEAVKSLKGVSGEITQYKPVDDEETKARDMTLQLFDAYVELLESEVGDMERVAKPIMDTKKASEDERRKAREEGLRILRSFRKRLQVQPMTTELLKAPFKSAKTAVAPVFRGLDKYEYTLTTCI